MMSTDKQERALEKMVENNEIWLRVSSTRQGLFCMLRIQCLCGHKLLNFLLLKIVKNVSTCRPRLGYFCTQKLCLRLHKRLANKAVYLALRRL
jgi:hypothetical protein